MDIVLQTSTRQPKYIKFNQIQVQLIVIKDNFKFQELIQNIWVCNASMELPRSKIKRKQKKAWTSTGYAFSQYSNNKRNQVAKNNPFGWVNKNRHENEINQLLKMICNNICSMTFTVPSWHPASIRSWWAEGDHSIVRGMLCKMNRIRKLKN